MGCLSSIANPLAARGWGQWCFPSRRREERLADEWTTKGRPCRLSWPESALRISFGYRTSLQKMMSSRDGHNSPRLCPPVGSRHSLLRPQLGWQEYIAHDSSDGRLRCPVLPLCDIGAENRTTSLNLNRWATNVLARARQVPVHFGRDCELKAPRAFESLDHANGVGLVTHP